MERIRSKEASEADYFRIKENSAFMATGIEKQIASLAEELMEEEKMSEDQLHQFMDTRKKVEMIQASNK